MKTDGCQKLIRFLRHDRPVRIAGAGCGVVFLAISARLAALGIQTAALIESTQGDLKVEHLYGYTTTIWFATVVFLSGLQVLTSSVAGNPVGRLAVQLWDRVEDLEKRLAESAGPMDADRAH